jgi:ADP-heptose:LPS heptosyltransferase
MIRRFMPSVDPAMPNSMTAPRVLVIRRRYLGDVVLLGSVFRNLRLKWPASQIDVLTESTYMGVLGINPDVTNAVTMPSSSNLGALLGLANRLRRTRYTHVFDVDNTDKTALLSFATGAPIRITFHRETGRLHFRWAYTRFAELGDVFYATRHITDTYLELLRPAGVEIQTHQVRLVPRKEDIAAVSPLLHSGLPGNRRRLLVHPGSRSPYRIWPVERFAAVCDRVQKELGVEVYIVAGPGEVELARQIREQMETSVTAIERPLSIGEFAALASSCDLFLCHDSGPMHVAAAVGTPVVALLSSQNAAIWRPFGAGHTVLQTPLPCACIGKEAPTPCDRNNGYRSYCVRMIKTDEAFAAIRAALEKNVAAGVVDPGPASPRPATPPA